MSEGDVKRAVPWNTAMSGAPTRPVRELLDVGTLRDACQNQAGCQVGLEATEDVGIHAVANDDRFGALDAQLLVRGPHDLTQNGLARRSEPGGTRGRHAPHHWVRFADEVGLDFGDHLDRPDERRASRDEPGPHAVLRVTVGPQKTGAVPDQVRRVLDLLVRVVPEQTKGL